MEEPPKSRVGDNNNIAPKLTNFQSQQPRPPRQEKKLSLEETVQQLAMSTQSFMTATDTQLKNQAAVIHNLKVQIG